MKIKTVALTAISAIAITIFPSISLAAASGGLAAPLNEGQGLFGVSLGYVRRDVDGGSYDGEAASRRICMKGAFGLGEGLDAYAFLGFADVDYDGIDFTGSLGEMVGGGIRYGGLLLGGGPARVVLDLQLEYFLSDDGGEEAEVTTKSISAYVVQEFGAAGRIGYFYPYAGVRLSDADYDNEGFVNFDSSDHLGFFGGADYFVNPNVFFSLELHILDEESLTLSAGYRF
ncbi:MAG: hypothetical protein C0609_06600 [Deltaproteobacteria bacterium]|nr:MAG: hypothetical protein C0609_06600 [Deltaproteobacteria bacterium]